MIIKGATCYILPVQLVVIGFNCIVGRNTTSRHLGTKVHELNLVGMILLRSILGPRSHI